MLSRFTQNWGCSWCWHSSRYWCCFLCTGSHNVGCENLWWDSLGYHAMMAVVVLYWSSRHYITFLHKKGVLGICAGGIEKSIETIFWGWRMYQASSRVFQWAGPQWFHQHPCGWGARFHRQESFQSLVISESIRYTNHMSIIEAWVAMEFNIDHQDVKALMLNLHEWCWLIALLMPSPLHGFSKKHLSLLVPTLV